MNQNRSQKFMDAYDGLTLSMEHLEEFIHLGEVAARQNDLRNPDYYFSELNEKAKVLRGKLSAIANLM